MQKAIETDAAQLPKLDLEAGRRAFLRTSGLMAAGAAVLGMGMRPGTADAMPSPSTSITDPTILNFALNLEYLEAEFYLRAAFGRGLSDADVTGKGTLGKVMMPGGHPSGDLPQTSVAHDPQVREGNRERRGKPREAAALGARVGGGRASGDQPRQLVHRRGACRRADLVHAGVQSVTRATSTSCWRRTSSRMSASRRTRARRGSSRTLTSWRPLPGSWPSRPIMPGRSARC